MRQTPLLLMVAVMLLGGCQGVSEDQDLSFEEWVGGSEPCSSILGDAETGEILSGRWTGMVRIGPDAVPHSVELSEGLLRVSCETMVGDTGDANGVFEYLAVVLYSVDTSGTAEWTSHELNLYRGTNLYFFGGVPVEDSPRFIWGGGVMGELLLYVCGTAVRLINIADDVVTVRSGVIDSVADRFQDLRLNQSCVSGAP